MKDGRFIVVLTILVTLGILFGLNLMAIERRQDMIIEKQQIVMNDYKEIILCLNSLEKNISSNNENIEEIHSKSEEIKVQVYNMKTEISNEYSKLINCVNELIEWRVNHVYE